MAKTDIIVTIRLTPEELTKAIQIFIANNQTPKRISNLVKTIFKTGLTAVYDNNAKTVIPIEAAQEILNTLTSQGKKTPTFHIKPKSPVNLTSSVEVEEEGETDLKYRHLLDELSLEDKTSGYMILKNLETTNDILGNLNSSNDKIASLTAKMFYPTCQGTPEQEDIIKTYNKFYKKEY